RPFYVSKVLVKIRLRPLGPLQQRNCHGLISPQGFPCPTPVPSIYGVKATSILSITYATLLLTLAASLPCYAQACDSSSNIELESLAQNANARQTTIESELASLDRRTPPPGVDAAAFAADTEKERQRLTDLRDRNARLIEAYQARLGTQSETSDA